MNEKVKLPREVAEALEASKHMGMVSIMGHIAHFHGDKAINTTPDLFVIAQYYKKNPYIMASAIINGYEVETTPEEKLKKAYDSFLNADMEPMDYGEKEHAYFQAGMRVALKILGIRISGVNA